MANCQELSGKKFLCFEFILAGKDHAERNIKFP